MPTATIEAKYINTPQPGKKMGSIKSADGTYYGVAPELLPQFKQGGVYEIFFEDREWQGKTYHTVKTVKATTQTAAAAGTVLAQAERARTPDTESRQIFVCALLVAAIKAGQVNILEASDLIAAVDNSVLARNRLLEGGQPKPATAPKTNSQAADEDPMNDEVPF